MAAVTAGASGPIGLTFDAESQNLAGEAVAIDALIVQATKAKAAVDRGFAVELDIGVELSVGRSWGSPWAIGVRRHSSKAVHGRPIFGQI
jgi:hypothetical protein